MCIRDSHLTVRATDPGGSQEVDPPTIAWRVDTIPPVTFANRTSRRYSTDRTVEIEVGCVGEDGLPEEDPCSYCWASTSVPDGCSMNTTVRLQASTDGDHSVAIHAVDAAGWADTTPAHVQWTVDATGRPLRYKRLWTG